MRRYIVFFIPSIFFFSLVGIIIMYLCTNPVALHTFTNFNIFLTILILLTIIFSAISGVILSLYTKKLERLEAIHKGLLDIVHRDSLTGAPNLEKFKLDAQLALDRNPNKKFAVIYADFENFKYLNNVFGYAYGDKLLKEYSQLLNDDMGADDHFCRVSADNFLVLRKYESKDALLSQQTSIDERVAQYSLASKEQYLLWMCCGICCIEDTDEELKIADIIERANFARKNAKGDPINHYVFYNESIRATLLKEKAIEKQMYNALDKEEFLVYLQPKVDIETNLIASAEALVRWRTSDGKIIPPGDFIPIFERNLFVVQLDKYVFEKVCRWMRMQMDAGIPIVPISVNVSRMQLYDPDFVSTYVAIKDVYAIPKDLLEIEFTESVVFDDMTLLLEIIKELNTAGMHCSLDDFGTGYSSLNLLKSLPVDALKLDGMFFHEGSNPQRANTVIEGIVAMARKLNLTIVAECVEYPHQVDFLRKIGCHLVQGYVFFRPMPMADFENEIAKQFALTLPTPTQQETQST